MTLSSTAMAAEIHEAPAALARFFEREQPALRTAAQHLAARDPRVIVTCARGSSDHAAAYFKYLTEILMGVPVASLGPSIASLYAAPLRLADGVILSVSQSGKSPDIVTLQTEARKAGALAIAVVNQAHSPLAEGADALLPLHAGEERSVAATKSFLSSAAILAALVAEWRNDAALKTAVRALPDALAAALTADWSEVLPVLTAAPSAYIIGRGPALPVAAEAALKLKETAMLHAEAFSGAEVMHGPLQLVDRGFPILAFRPQDAAFAAMGAAVERLRAAGGRVFVVEAGPRQPGRLPVTPSLHPLLDPLVMALAFYALAEQVARARGQDPDRPSRLNKVTETL